MKWGFLAKPEGVPRYLVCNADESEPGTFKDRQLMERDPHQVLEGIVLACYAIGAQSAYIYIRGEMVLGSRILERAIGEARAAGYIGKNILGTGVTVEVWVHRGAGAYICGEETALLESLEGKRGLPDAAFPWVARLRASDPNLGTGTDSSSPSSPGTVLLRVETGAGAHGGPSGRYARYRSTRGTLRNNTRPAPTS